MIKIIKFKVNVGTGKSVLENLVKYRTDNLSKTETKNSFHIYVDESPNVEVGDVILIKDKRLFLVTNKTLPFTKNEFTKKEENK